jgi:hypothetical protein
MAESEAAVGFLGPGLVRRLVDRSRLSLPKLRPGQRALLFAAITWLPMAILTIAEGSFVGSGWVLSRDVAAYLRFLLVGPLLAAIGPTIDRKLAGAVRGWGDTVLVPPERQADFQRFLDRLEALRRSPWPAFGLTVVAYALPFLALTTRIGGDQRWLFTGERSGALAPSGWWLVLVSLPLFFRTLLAWAWRFGLWAATLLRMATLPLRVMGTHPDGVGGLEPLTRAHNLLLPLPASIAAGTAGGLANDILHRGIALATLRPSEIFLVVILGVVYLGPLLAFTPLLLAGRRRSSVRYGAVAGHHAALLERETRKALDTTPPKRGLLAGDLLEDDANLAQSYASVTNMRISLVYRANLLLFAMATVGPLLPLELTEVPAMELLQRLRGALL